MVKGKQVAISGKLVNKNWTDKDGKACNATEILVSDILLMGGKKTKKSCHGFLVISLPFWGLFFA